MSDKEVLLTPDGLKRLEDELENLKSVKRREVAERIKVAIGYGDISENSEYEDAKNEQAFIEGRIITLEKMLRNARIINNDEIDSGNGRHRFHGHRGGSGIRRYDGIHDRGHGRIGPAQ